MARFYRKGRRGGSRGIWLPPVQTLVSGAVNISLTGGQGVSGEFFADSFGCIEGQVPANTDGDEATNLVSGPGGLAFLNATGFTVKRIVGSIFCSLIQDAGSTCAVAEVFCGLFIDRILQDGSPELLNNWTPDRISAARKRWIWQRRWMLTNTQQASSPDVPESYPLTNAEYGDIRSGPHVDAKTVARVGAQENLFFYSAVRCASFYSEDNPSIIVNIYPRLRFFSTRPYAARNRE